MVRGLKRTLYRAARNVRHPRRLVETRRIRAEVADFPGGDAELYSVDLPREVGRDYDPGTFYEGEGKAGIPAGSEPGWLIPPRLKERWTLILGRTQEELPPLLERVGAVDSFMHDSEHSFDCMWFEFNEAWPHLRAGGVLLSDDVNSTAAFPRFAREHGRKPVRLARGMALLQK